MPATLIGLPGLLGGGGVQRQGRVLEFWGGTGRWFLRCFPLVKNAAAITFGHVILAQSQADLDVVRDHELVHVRQHERWGPLFIPAYLLCMVVLWVGGRNGYLDNPFEQEAYERTR